MGCGCSDSGMPCKCSKHGVLSPITADSFPAKQRSKRRNVKKAGGSPQLLPIGAPPGGGHVIGHVVWLGPQPQLVEPFILDVGGGQHLAGGIFRIGGGQQVGGGIFNLANVASPIDLRAEVAPPISVAPSRCDCKKATCYDGSEDSCAHPKGCCPTVVTITPKLEQPEMSPNQDTPCFFGPNFQLDATLHLACDCTKDDGTKAKCPKVRFGVIQVCQFRHKIEYADFTRCDQFGIRIVHSIDATAEWLLDTPRKGASIWIPLARTPQESECGNMILNTFKDRPGLNLSAQLPASAATFIPLGQGAIKDFRPIAISSFFDAKTFIVSQCIDCTPRCCCWYKRAQVDWEFTLLITLDSNFSKACQQGRWDKADLCKVPWIDLGTESVAAIPETFNDTCDELDGDFILGCDDGTSRANVVLDGKHPIFEWITKRIR